MKKVLIMQDEDISVYNEDNRLGGIITVVNNHNNESRYKEWRWYQYSDGTVFNDKKYVIDMLSNFVRQLIDKEK